MKYPKSTSKQFHFFTIFLKFFTATILLGFSGGVCGRVNCYHCAWTREGEELLPSAAIVSDICRPQNFNPHIVHTESCSLSCLTLILYEYVPDQSQSQLPFKGKTKNDTSNIIPFSQSIKSKNNKTKLNPHLYPPLGMKSVMAVYIRGCTKDNLIRTEALCKGKTIEKRDEDDLYHYEKRCFCQSNYCNGEISSANLILSQTKFIFLFFLLLLIF